MQTYEQWLWDSSNPRVWLLELTHSGGVETLAQGVYTQPGDTVWHDALRGIELADGIDTDRSIQDLEIINAGQFDSWLDRQWRGHPVRLYLGDPRWPREQFRLSGSMINGGIDRAADNVLRFTLHNPLEALDQPLIDGQAESVPVIFGSVFNVTAQVSDNNLGYVVHSGPVTISAVRDRGGAVSYSDQSRGFRLSQMPRGTVTFDATAAGGTAAALVQLLCAGTGLVPNAASLAALPGWPLGIAARSDETRRSVLDQLLSGLGATAVINALGELEIRQLEPPAPVPDHVLYPSAVRRGGLEITGIEPARGSVTVRYGRNNTVQDARSLNTGTDVSQGGISAADLRRYGIEWRVISERLSTQPLAPAVTIDSPFTTTAAAEARLSAVRALRGEARTYARIQCVPAAVQLIRAGISLQITYRRYGLAAGRCVRVLSVKPKSGELEVFW